MSDMIPVTFNLEGKEYKGAFSQVSGSASAAMFHLYVEKFYWGQLWQTEGVWRFASNQHPGLEKLVDEFEYLIIAHYQ